MYRNITSIIFQKKIFSRTYSDPKFGRRGRGVSFFEARIKDPERRSGFRPSEKERQERRSVTKIPLAITVFAFAIQQAEKLTECLD
jgi:hypothetical protein